MSSGVVVVAGAVELAVSGVIILEAAVISYLTPFTVKDDVNRKRRIFYVLKIYTIVHVVDTSSRHHLRNGWTNDKSHLVSLTAVSYTHLTLPTIA